MIVNFFEKPIIGYCRDCNEIAVYGQDLYCPKCQTRILSIFEWDGKSIYPEDIEDDYLDEE